MLSSYTNPETIVYKKKEETLKISKKNNDMKNNDILLPNSSSTDDEKERMKKEWEKIKNMDTTELDKQYSLYKNLTISY